MYTNVYIIDVYKCIYYGCINRGVNSKIIFINIILFVIKRTYLLNKLYSVTKNSLKPGSIYGHKKNIGSFNFNNAVFRLYTQTVQLDILFTIG